MKAHDNKASFLTATAVYQDPEASQKQKDEALECILAYDGEDIRATDKRVFDVLMKATQTENRYLGGIDEPIVSIKWSEDRERIEVVLELVEKIISALKR